MPSSKLPLLGHGPASAYLSLGAKGEPRTNTGHIVYETKGERTYAFSQEYSARRALDYHLLFNDD